MRFGPCGGVRADLGCEMAPIPCPFAQSDDVPRWDGPDLGNGVPPGLLAAAGSRPVVLTDLTVRPFDAVHVGEVVRALDGACDGLLVGEHQNRPDFPPVLMAVLVREAGGSPWITLSCRDRNRVVLEQEIAGLARVGVLCVTGDGRRQGVRPGVTQVFDIDGTRLAAQAAQAGLNVAGPSHPRHLPGRCGCGRSNARARTCACSTTSRRRPTWRSSPRPHARPG